MWLTSSSSGSPLLHEQNKQPQAQLWASRCSSLSALIIIIRVIVVIADFLLFNIKTSAARRPYRSAAKVNIIHSVPLSDLLRK